VETELRAYNQHDDLVLSLERTPMVLKRAHADPCRGAAGLAGGDRNPAGGPLSMFALDDITVLSLENGISAPLCTRMLGDFGAEVIKVERPDVGT